MSVDNKYFPKNRNNLRLKSMRRNSLRLIGVRLSSFLRVKNNVGWGGSILSNKAMQLNVYEYLHIRLLIVKFLDAFDFIKGVWVLFNNLPRFPITKKHLNSWMGKGKGPFAGFWVLICRQYSTLCTIEGLSKILLKKLKFHLDWKLNYLNLTFKLWRSNSF